MNNSLTYSFFAQDSEGRLFYFYCFSGNVFLNLQDMKILINQPLRKKFLVFVIGVKAMTFSILVGRS